MGSAGSIFERENFCAARKAFRTEIRKSQEKSWADLSTAVDNDPWRLPYKIVSKKIGRQQPGLAAIGRERVIADALFPTRPVVDWLSIPIGNRTKLVKEVDKIDCPSLTMEEFNIAAARLLRGKETGLDEVPNEVLAVTARKSFDVSKMPRRSFLPEVEKVQTSIITQGTR